MRNNATHFKRTKSKNFYKFKNVYNKIYSIADLFDSIIACCQSYADTRAHQLYKSVSKYRARCYNSAIRYILKEMGK